MTLRNKKLVAINMRYADMIHKQSLKVCKLKEKLKIEEKFLKDLEDEKRLLFK